MIDLIRSTKELKKLTGDILRIGTIVCCNHKVVRKNNPTKDEGGAVFIRGYVRERFYRMKTGVVTGVQRVYTGTYRSDRDHTEPINVKAALFYRVRFGMLNAEVLCDPRTLQQQGTTKDFELPLTERRTVRWTEREKRLQSEAAKEAPRDPVTGQFQKESFTAGG